MFKIFERFPRPVNINFENFYFCYLFGFKSIVVMYPFSLYSKNEITPYR